MAEQKALVIIAGQIQQLPSGDTLAGVAIAWGAFYEPVLSVNIDFMFDAAGNIMLVYGG